MIQPPATIGMALADVDTPALLVDLDVFEANLRRMSDAARAANVRLRPHAKTHKCAKIALQQVALGAVGVCCQKVSEAQALVDNGVNDVLLSNQVVGRTKIERLHALHSAASVTVCVDDAGNVDEIARVFDDSARPMDVLVEINVGANRCGVEPGRQAVELAQHIATKPGLRFAGLQAYQGSAQHLRTHAARGQAIANATDLASQTVSMLKEAGLSCDTITGAGTGTFGFEASSGVYTELQCGSYIFMDADYARNQDDDGGFKHPFAHSLFVYASVMSKPEATRVIVDAGLKAISMDSGMPLCADDPHATYSRPSDEHGNLAFANESSCLSLGDKVRLVPGHCDPTVNLHDWYVCVRGERVEALWPIVARGALF